MINLAIVTVTGVHDMSAAAIPADLARIPWLPATHRVKNRSIKDNTSAP
jgi:hypothetical protein